MLEELRLLLRGEPNRAPITAYFRDIGINIDDADEEVEPLEDLEPISGFACVIHYSDARGQTSERRITCQRLDVAATERYLRAFCHERGAIRMFKVDRILQVVDLHTGETGGPEFFARFVVGHVSSAGLTWGLSPVRRAEVLAGLNALAFMARCDGRFHPAEREVLERFICAYWMREELPIDPPIAQILEHADRLKPDPETFFVSLTKCGSRSQLARLVRQTIVEIIDADGVVAKEEFF